MVASHCTLATAAIRQLNRKGAYMFSRSEKEEIFSLTKKDSNGVRRNILKILCSPIEHLLSLKSCSKVYDQFSDIEDSPQFLEGVLTALDISPVLAPEEIKNIPIKGGVVVVANHPYGAIEGIILAKLLRSVRPDVKIMANFLLGRIPQFANMLISVDPFENKQAIRKNLRPIRDAIRWVKNGGILMVFPAGEVSHMHLKKREISDPAWSPVIAQIIRKASVPVVPVFFKGANSPLFQTLGMIHPMLRTALLARELMNKRRKKIHLKIGKMIPFRRLKRFETNNDLIDYLRWRTYLLRKGIQSRTVFRNHAFTPLKKVTKPVISPQPTSLMKKEIECLPDHQLLVQSGDFQVWQASADQIPETLIEIGRLREVNFRAASEGTGEPLDIDRFDDLYIHIFIWNTQQNEIVGAYRIGCTDRLIKDAGTKRLYTATLFHSSKTFYDTIGPALELGRSFVRMEYQKSYAPLLLLWKGIGSFIAKHPQYRMLFGPVSISNDYSNLSKKLIATTLLNHNQAKDIASMIRPKTAPKFKPVRIPGFNFTRGQRFFHDIEEVCAVIADIELEVKTIPILLKHYMNLGGQLLAFNMDKSFNNCMDGLILVDLLKTEPKTLKRYMGEEGINSFYDYHQEFERRAAESNGTLLSRGSWPLLFG